MNEAFGNWLAGFIDGEGCFLIPCIKERGQERFSCRFSIVVREDDADIIRDIREFIGFGNVTWTTPKRGNPQVCLKICSKEGCQRIVDILDTFPLRAKKLRDFQIWRRAVSVWRKIHRKNSRGSGNGSGSARSPHQKLMAVLRDKLNDVRRFQ